MSRQPSSGSPRKIFRQASAYQYDSEHQARSKADMTEFELKQLFPKHVWKPGTLLMPVPVVLVSCGGGKSPYAPNIITVAWAGTICSDPAMLSISVRQERYSHEIICRTQEFVVNVPIAQQAKITDWCGMKSGRDVETAAASSPRSTPTCLHTRIPNTTPSGGRSAPSASPSENANEQKATTASRRRGSQSNIAEICKNLFFPI